MTTLIDEGIDVSRLSGARDMPLVLGAHDAPPALADWVDARRASLETALLKHGALLFRGFPLDCPADFESFAEAISPGLYGEYGDLPKQEGGRNTYRSTPYPERKMILFHNESSHLTRWPRRQFFFCELPADSGGATPIVDCRRMLTALPPAIVESFERKGLMYVRTFVRGLDVPWRDFFGTDDRAQVERRCEAQRVGYEWLPGDGLQTRTVSPAVIRHPLSGERSFFNQLQLHHAACLDPDVRRDLAALVGESRMPRQVYFGDGSPIDDAIVRQVGDAYEACAVRFDWRRGDVLMLDNMLVAHARDPYRGPRKIVVAMGEMTDRDALVRAPPPAA